MERDDHEILATDLEIHFINMKAFVKRMEELNDIGELDEADLDSFSSWLTLITQKSIVDRETIRRVCERKELKEAVEALVRLSSDKVRRQAYQRRLDELRTYNHVMEQLAEKDATIAEKDATIADKDAEIANRDAEIARLRAQLEKQKGNGN